MPEQYFDPEGLTEPHTTPYTLTVYIPPRLPPRWLPSLFTPQHAKPSDKGPSYKILAEDINSKLDSFELEHLRSLPTKSITITSSWFLPELRCKHLQTGATVCDQGCYFLEKGGDEMAGWRCNRRDCEGHMYCGQVMKDSAGKVCFGKRGKRMVCIYR